MQFRIEAPLSPLLDPLKGLSRLSCGKLGLEGRSRLLAVESGRRGVLEVSGLD